MAEKLMEFKNIVIKIVFAFLAEVGNISRFDNTKQLQKLARLVINENTSGKRKG